MKEINTSPRLRNYINKESIIRTTLRSVNVMRCRPTLGKQADILKYINYYFETIQTPKIIVDFTSDINKPKNILEKALTKAEELLKDKITSEDQNRLVDEYLDKVVA